LPNVVANYSNPKRKLSKANKDQRLQFCIKNRNRDWASVMFTDRCRFTLKYPGVCFKKKIWRKSGEQLQEYFPTKPSSTYNVYGGITIHGPTKLIPVTGTIGLKSPRKFMTRRKKLAKSITQSEYTAVARRLLTEGLKLFKGKAWGLIQDNDKTHKGMQPALKAWSRHHPRNVCVIKFPPNSPDLNLLRMCGGTSFPRWRLQDVRPPSSFMPESTRSFPNCLSHTYNNYLAAWQEG